jgi:hypothetical protein
MKLIITVLFAVITLCTFQSCNEDCTTCGLDGSGNMGDNYSYITQVIEPNTYQIDLTVGTRYYGFTSVPTACGPSYNAEACYPIAIYITGIANGKYTYTVDLDDSYTAYIEADKSTSNQYYTSNGGKIKTDIAVAISKYGFAIVR